MCDHHGHEAVLNDGLDLLLVAGRDVGQEPDGLLGGQGVRHREIGTSRGTLLIFSLLWLSRLGKCSSAPWFSTVWVWSSVPVTMLPTALGLADD